MKANHRRSRSVPRCLGAILVILSASLLPVATGHTGAGAAPTRAAKTPYTATGYFHLALKKGRWWLVTPDGQPFYAAGIDHVSASGDTDRVTGQCPYCNTIASQFPTVSAWDTATMSTIRSWGFNTLGPYSDTALDPQMPYEVQLAMATGDDWFAPSFVTNADSVAATQVAPLAHDPNVIGYFTDSELQWGGNGANPNPVLNSYLALPAGSPGLAVAQQYVGNPEGFVYALASRYFQVTTAAVKRYDPNHLILGVKAEAQEIDAPLLEAASPYVDVFSIDDYNLGPGFAQIVDQIWPQYIPVAPDLSSFEQIVKRPLIVGEYSFLGATSQTPNTHPGVLDVYPDQNLRAAALGNYLAPLYQDAPWVVGDDWFEYVDEPAGGRIPDGEDNNYGLLDVEGQVYQPMVRAMQLLHSVAPDRLSQTGPTCDSWLRTGTAVSCGATLPPATYAVNIVDQPPPGGTQGAVYSDTVYADGGKPGYSFAVTQGGLPPGLKLKASTGVVSGTPKVAGTFTFTVEVTDAKGSTATQPLSIAIAPNTPASITSATLKKATPNKAYATTLGATGGVSPYTWSLTGGALPAGLTLSSGGVISGTPTASGTFTFGVGLSDSSLPAETAGATFSLTVKAVR